MNAYDFDGTIYDGDSTVDFFLYSLKKKPALIRYLPKQAAGFILYKRKRFSKTQLKERFFCFLAGIDPAESVEAFWNVNQKKINAWYLAQQAADDIVISASPEFLLKPVCERLGIKHLIASRVDPRSGKFFGENCRAQEKVKRFQAQYKTGHINKFYSDSTSDLPMAQIADEAFLVTDGKITVWDRSDT